MGGGVVPAVVNGGFCEDRCQACAFCVCIVGYVRVTVGGGFGTGVYWSVRALGWGRGASKYLSGAAWVGNLCLHVCLCALFAGLFCM